MATTDAEGRFSFDCVPDAPMTLWVQLENTVHEAKRELHIEDGKSLQVNLHLLEAKGVLAGRVTNSDRAAVPDAALEIMMLNSHVQRGYGCVTDKNGDWRLESLLPGSYIIIAHEGKLLAPLIHNHIQVRNGEQTTVNFVLSKGGSIIGRVLDEDGRAFGLARIDTFSFEDDAEKHIAEFPDGLGYAESRTDEGGHFTLKQLSPGTYPLRVKVEGRPAMLLLANIVVKDGETTEAGDLKVEAITKP